MSWNHYDHFYQCRKCGKVLSEKSAEDDLHEEVCKGVDAETLQMRKAARRRQIGIEMATEGLDIDEHGYVI